jgi:hypothetical protein
MSAFFNRMFFVLFSAHRSRPIKCAFQSPCPTLSYRVEFSVSAVRATRR